jgi:hypothetical protein
MEIEIREFKQISGAEDIDFSGFKVRKINKTTRALVGPVIVKATGIDNDVKMEHLVYKKQGGEYRKLPYNLPPQECCDFLNNDPYVFSDFVKVSDFPNPIPCPLPNVRFKAASIRYFTFLFSDQIHCQRLHSGLEEFPRSCVFKWRLHGRGILEEKRGDHDPLSVIRIYY